MRRRAVFERRKPGAEALSVSARVALESRAPASRRPRCRERLRVVLASRSKSLAEKRPSPAILTFAILAHLFRQRYWRLTRAGCGAPITLPVKTTLLPGRRACFWLASTIVPVL